MQYYFKICVVFYSIQHCNSASFQPAEFADRVVGNTGELKENNMEQWKTMETAPKDNTLLLLAFKEYEYIEVEVGMYVENYGCPGWRIRGTFVKPILWTHIPQLPDDIK